MSKEKQMDIEEFAKTVIPRLEFEEFEKRGVDYFLKKEQTPSVTGILGAGGGGKASANGNALHEALNIYFSEKFNSMGITVKELFKDCNTEDFQIPVHLSSFFKEHNLKVFASEYKFHFEIEGCKYAGTIDLITVDNDGNLWIFDYKSGLSKDMKHHLQVATYSRSIEHLYKQYNRKVRGFLVYRTGIEEVDLSLFETDFKPLLLAYYGKMEGYINHRGKIYASNNLLLAHSEAIKERKLEIDFYKSQIEQLESEIEVDKNTIIDTLEAEKSFKDDNILLTFTKGKTKEIITKDGTEAIQSIRDKNPEWFKVEQGKPFYTLRLATDNKE